VKRATVSILLVLGLATDLGKFGKWFSWSGAKTLCKSPS